jgi:hypothetical protein
MNLQRSTQLVAVRCSLVFAATLLFFVTKHIGPDENGNPNWLFVGRWNALCLGTLAT